MVFKKYNSIENSYQKAFVYNITLQGFGSETFVVQEKIHGANFCMITNGNTIRCAKRTAMLKEEEPFYNWQSVRDKHKNGMLQLFHILKAQDNSVNEVAIYGELFGGGYPHPSIHMDNTQVLIQRGIYYSPDVCYMAFDILVNGTNWLPVHQANQLLAQCGFMFAATLFQGSLQACLNFNPTFTTTIPAMLGLPAIEGNIAEGVVIRPANPLFFRNGSRILLKHKNEQWSENNAKIDSDILKKVFAVESIEENSELKKLEQQLFTFLSENRFQNVVSKVGIEVATKQSGQLLGMFCKDALADFQKSDAGATFNALTKSDQKLLTHSMTNYAKKLVPPLLVNLQNKL